MGFPAFFLALVLPLFPIALPYRVPSQRWKSYDEDFPTVLALFCRRLVLECTKKNPGCRRTQRRKKRNVVFSGTENLECWALYSFRPDGLMGWSFFRLEGIIGLAAGGYTSLSKVAGSVSNRLIAFAKNDIHLFWSKHRYRSRCPRMTACSIHCTPVQLLFSQLSTDHALNDTRFCRFDGKHSLFLVLVFGKVPEPR